MMATAGVRAARTWQIVKFYAIVAARWIGNAIYQGSWHVWLWWKTGPRRWWCRRVRSHQGKWAVIHRQAHMKDGRVQTMPILATCQRCYAIAEFDMQNRTVRFD